jgi:hypothetical protein
VITAVGVDVELTTGRGDELDVTDGASVGVGVIEGVELELGVGVKLGVDVDVLVAVGVGVITNCGH